MKFTLILPLLKLGGEVNEDKIYIDAETNTSYRYDVSEKKFVSIGDNSFEKCKGIYPKFSNSITTFKLTQNELDYINSLQCLSLLISIRGVIERPDWYRYVSPLVTENSNGLKLFYLGYEGGIKIFENTGNTANTDFKHYITSLKNIISINRVEGKVIAYNEVEKFIEEQLDRFKQPDFLGNNPYLSYTRGDATCAIYNYVIFNFDVNRVLRFNTELLTYLRTSETRIPDNLLYGSTLPVSDNFDKYVPDNYGNYWGPIEKDVDGYTIVSTNTKGIRRYICNDGGEKYLNKACCIESVFEILEGSAKVVNVSGEGSVFNFRKLHKIVNVITGEEKEKEDELTAGKWKIVYDNWRNDTYTVEIESVQVPVKIKCISQEIYPYAGIIQLNCQKLYPERKVFDSIQKIFRTTSTDLTGTTVSLTSCSSGTKAPTRVPRFLGEKFYNTSTGDIYEAGNLTTFKKITQ